ncbi:hypothetical protein H4R18_001965 [Coemansia javaensis]|uniref:SAM-dependent MTase RsmB/NOP-type domain-containing protein n=1 Tax=Coemansia javaensis TaxID=2761396 RepID=A0A9W8HE69_9FUNG|nr:hypothetical protein H4R18_001965 [Coemansia javaensis]
MESRPGGAAGMAANFPEQFLVFLRENNIDPGVYDACETLPRYLRIVQHGERSSEEVLALVEQVRRDARCEVAEVAGVPGFLRVADRAVRLSQLQAHASGDVVGMDVSSGVAVLALGVEPGHNVLDLCCAPGAKLLCLAEGVAPAGSVTGVDVSPARIATCRSLVKRHAGSARMLVRLYAEDGAVFSARAPRDRWWDPQALRDSGRGRQQQRGGPWCGSRLLGTEYAASGGELYDRVLVDAECTHDGSLAHIEKYRDLGWHLLATQLNRGPDVPALQLRLLENGWRLLRTGGVLVYSTCSLAAAQNECVLAAFLARHPADEARLEPVFGEHCRRPPIPVLPAQAPPAPGDVRGRLQHAVRLDPRVSGTSGLFIARIRKLRGV